jgi:hypothetical protein
MLDSVGSDFDEEEFKPNVHLLDTLSNGTARKRSRSIDDEGDRNSKAIRSTNGTPGVSRSSSALNSGVNSAVDTPSPAPQVPTVEVAGVLNDGAEESMADDPMVFGKFGLYPTRFIFLC